MDNIGLLPDEQLITQSSDASIRLTNKRLISTASSWGNSNCVYLLLAHVNSCAVHYRHKPLILIIGILLCLGSLGFVFSGVSDDEAGIALMVLLFGVLLIVYYFVTRRHVVSIYSDGGTNIHFSTKGMDNEDVLAFVNKVHKAKLELK